MIDNYSTDDSVEYVKSNYPDINIFQTGQNMMYSGGYNYFFKHNSENCYYMLLNNDTILDKNILKEFMSGVSKYGENNIYGPRIMYMNEKNKIWYSGGKVDLKKGVIKHLNIREDYDKLNLADSKTDYITGCCLFTHTDTLRKLNGFDDSFNMYMEDVDFCLRAKHLNIDSHFLASPIVFHHISGSVKRKILKMIFSYIKLSIKHTGILSIFNIPVFVLRKLFRI